MTQFANLEQLQSLRRASVSVTARRIRRTAGPPATPRPTSRSRTPRARRRWRSSCAPTSGEGRGQALRRQATTRSCRSHGATTTCRCGPASPRRCTRRTSAPSSVVIRPWSACPAGTSRIRTCRRRANPHERLELALEPRVADLGNDQRETDPRRGTRGRGAGRRRRSLRQPHHARVVAEVVVAQLRVAVEPELAPRPCARTSGPGSR